MALRILGMGDIRAMTNYWNQAPDNIKIIGHRGAKALWPENTMISFENAVKLGVDGLEMDLNLTRDGRLAVIHDETVDRTTDGKGLVSDFSMAELKGLDAGVALPGFDTQRIPEFEEYLEFVEHTNLLLNVEVKQNSLETADKAIAALDRRGLLDRTVMTCFYGDVTTYMHQKYGVKTQGFPKHRVKGYKDDCYSHYYAIGIGMNDLTPELVAELKAQNIDPWCWCPDTAEPVEYAINCGVTLMTCNDPRAAFEILTKRGLRK